MPNWRTLEIRVMTLNFLTRVHGIKGSSPQLPWTSSIGTNDTLFMVPGTENPVLPCHQNFAMLCIASG
jgi:hypothetical protein